MERILALSEDNDLNNGYASEAATGIIHFAIQELNISKFIAHCDSENISSYRVMEKLGIKLKYYPLIH